MSWKVPNRDANMNSLQTAEQAYSMGQYQRHLGNPNYNVMSMKQPVTDGHAHRGLNNMSYRDTRHHPREDSPSRPQPQLPPDLFDGFEDPPSPDGGGGGYMDDRIQNDLLDEICSDIGIKDATDLDLFDFDNQQDPYVNISQTRLPDDLECLDQTIPFSQLGDQQEMVGTGPGYNKGAAGGMPAHGYGYGQQGNRGTHGGYQLHHVPGSQGSDTTRSLKSGMLTTASEGSNECLASPTVSSTCQGSGSATGSSSQPGSISSNHSELPAIHSTSSHAYGNPNSVESGSMKTEEGAMSRVSKFSTDSPVPSPAMSLDSVGRLGPCSVGSHPNSTDRHDVTSTTPAANRDADTSTCTLVPPSPVKIKYEFDQAMTPGTPSSNRTLSSMPNTPNIKQEKQDSLCTTNLTDNHRLQLQQQQRLRQQAQARVQDCATLDGGYSTGGSVATGSHYGSTSSLNAPGSEHMDPAAKEKVLRYLDQNVPDTINLQDNLDLPNIGTGTTHSHPSSTNSSPPQHVAKRARVISSGNDLLEEMRERYSFVKDANIYDSQQKPTVPVQRSKPCSNVFQPVTHRNQPPGGALPYNQQQQQQQRGIQPSNYSANEQNTSCAQQQPQQPQQPQCMYGGQGSMPQTPRSSMQSNNAGMVTPQSGSQVGAYPQSYSTPRQQQQPSCQFQSNTPSSQYPSYPTNSSINNSYSNSCPDLSGSTPNSAQRQMSCPQGTRPYSPGMRPAGVPVAQSRMCPQPGQTANLGSMSRPMYGSQDTMETPATSPNAMSAQQGNMFKFPTNTNNRVSISAPSTPHKQMPNSNRMAGMQQAQGQYDQQGGYGTPAGQAQHQQPQQNVMFRTPVPPGGSHSNSQMSSAQPHINQGSYGGPAGAPAMQQRPQQNCAQYGPQSGMGPDGSIGSIPPQPHMTIPGDMGPVSGSIPAGPPQDLSEIPISQHGFMQQLISDRSSAFRSHSLFPLLRDLIIADMNFHTPSFPFALIANLPSDFDRLLQNYLQRNPPAANRDINESVDGVLMDALKYAHRALIEKIQSRKRKEGYKEAPKPLSAIEDFCERFDRAVKNTMSKPYESPSGMSDPMIAGGPGMMPNNPSPMGPPHGSMPPPSQPPIHHHPRHGMQPHHHNMMPGPHSPSMAAPGPPSHPHHPNPSMSNIHSGSYQDLSSRGMSVGQPPSYSHQMFSGLHDRRSNSLPPSPRKSFHVMHNPDSSSDHSVHKSKTSSQTSSSGNSGKSKVLPKEAVAHMMEWLREHQDNPYPNDDEKELLIQKTKLTINQINYWFTNARRRILPKWALQRYMEQQDKQKQIDQQQQQSFATTASVGGV